MKILSSKYKTAVTLCICVVAMKFWGVATHKIDKNHSAFYYISLLQKKNSFLKKETENAESL